MICIKNISTVTYDLFSLQAQVKVSSKPFFQAETVFPGLANSLIVNLRENKLNQGRAAFRQTEEQKGG